MQVVKVINALVFFVLAAAAAQNSLDTGRHFLGFKRLYDVIIRTQFQAQNLIIGFALCRQHNDGGLVVLADLAADFPPINAGHHHIQQHKVRVQLIKFLQCSSAIIGNGHTVSLFDQVQTQQFTDVFIIIHNQNFLV